MSKKVMGSLTSAPARLAAICLALVVLAQRGYASEEDYATWRSVTVVAEAGKPFNEVRVTAEMQDTHPPRLKLLKVSGNGRELKLPTEAFSVLKNPQLDTLKISYAADNRGGPPWLYVSFQLNMPERGVANWNYPRIHFAFQDGKFVKRFATIRGPDGGQVFDEQWKP